MNLKDYDVKEKINIGSKSKSYLLKDGTVLKIFRIPKSIEELERYKILLENSNDSFLFPFDFNYDSKKLYAYKYKFAKGFTLEKCFPSSDLVKLANNSVEFEKNIDSLSRAGIRLFDFHDENIIYDGSMYRAIDSDEYSIYNNPSDLQKINRIVHSTLISSLFIYNLTLLSHNSIALQKVKEYKALHMVPSDMILRIKDDLDKTFMDDIKTIDDLKKYR